jgi:hypothetical protein
MTKNYHDRGKSCYEKHRELVVRIELALGYRKDEGKNRDVSVGTTSKVESSGKWGDAVDEPVCYDGMSALSEEEELIALAIQQGFDTVSNQLVNGGPIMVE